MEAQTTPGWVRDLEKKRLRPHQLAHEVGAGAKCLSCGDACPGLDLHFWRKSCRNCKCGRERHDVQEQTDYQHFDILLGAGHKNSLRKTYELRVGGEKSEEVSFDWLPPGADADLAGRYMAVLPEDLRPVSGSLAAQRRREQLERQVPRHDVDPASCHQLSQVEVSGLESYREHLREGAVGQGRVATLAATLHIPLPPSLAKLPSSGNNRSSSPAKDISLEHTAQGKNFAGNVSPGRGEEDALPPPPSPGTLAQLDFPSPPPPLPSSLPPSLMQRPSAFLPSYMKDPNSNTVTPRDVNRNTLSVREKIQNEGLSQGLTPNLTYDPSKFSADGNQNQGLDPNITYDPSKISADGNQNPPDALPPSQHFDSSKVPPHVRFDLTKQPPTSHDQQAARLDNSQQATRLDNSELSADLAGLKLSEGAARCAQCHLEAEPGDVVVTAERAGPSVFWHPACFVCSTCQELLVDLIYFHKDGKLFCGRHFAEEVNIPRCAACDELIFTTEYTLAEGQHFHVRHFCCIECDIALAGKKYISREDQPCCLDCYQAKFSKVCLSCRVLIGAGESSVIWQQLHWHATPRCFRCTACGISLLNSKFAVREENALCSKECVAAFLRQRATPL